MLDKYKRVLLKYSGEALAGGLEFGLDMQIINEHAAQIKKLKDRNIDIILQVGGGNIFRGNSKFLSGLQRSAADQIGILSTVMNGVAIQNILEYHNIETRLMSAWPMNNVCETYVRRRALRHLKKGRVVICVAGTGNPFFTTDTAAALRAAELNCDCILKGTLVDGVYSADPLTDKNSKYIAKISYQEVVSRNLKFMDTAAIVLARDSNIPIVVFSIVNPSNLLGIFDGIVKYTLIE